MQTLESQAHVASRAVAGPVLARLSYVVPSGRRPVSYACSPPEGTPWEDAQYTTPHVPIDDARSLPMHVDAQGFALFHASSALAGFDDRTAIERIYYEEVLELALHATGAWRGWVFDHLVRRRDPGQDVLGFGRRGATGAPSANGRIHNDYSEASGRRRLALLLGDRAAAEVRRFAIVNVWRPIHHPVQDAPLALCDARTVQAQELVEGEVRYADRTGEIYLLAHSPLHRWYYAGGMQPDEALVFKQYDSQAGGVARFTPHAAFEHPHTPAQAPARQSIEARCLVIHD